MRTLKKPTVKKVFLKQLKRKLLFRYSKDDINSILNDYDEFFDIEIAQGKTEEDVCISLGDPKGIVANLYQETPPKETLGKSIFSKREVVQNITIFILAFIIIHVIYKLNHGANYMMGELLISYPIIVSLLWFLLKKASPVDELQKNKNSLVLLKVFHTFCFLTVLSLFFFFHNLVIGFANQNTGPIVVKTLYFFIILLSLIVLFSIRQFHKDQVAFYSIVCHALGALSIIIHYINMLYSLTSINTFLIEVRISWLLYLETIIVIAIFILLNYKRKRKVWMHN